MRVVNLAVLACVLTAMTRKGHQLFEEKVHPPQNILATPMSVSCLIRILLFIICRSLYSHLSITFKAH